MRATQASARSWHRAPAGAHRRTRRDPRRAQRRLLNVINERDSTMTRPEPTLTRPALLPSARPSWRRRSLGAPSVPRPSSGRPCSSLWAPSPASPPPWCLTPAFAASTASSGVWLALALVTLSAGLAPTFRRALGRSFLGLGARLLSSADQHRDAVWQRHRQHDADQRREDRRGGALMVGPAGILGFIVGGLLLVVGLVLSLGGRHA